MKISLPLIIFFLFVSAQNPPVVDKAEAKKAFEYLNKIRANPAAYSKELGVDLSKVKAQPALKWNDTLAKVAEAKAMDMAKRAYFAHVDPEGKGINIMIHEAGYKLNPKWINDKSKNFFESLEGGSVTGELAIRHLVIDSPDQGFGHRKHLLGMEEFYASNKDVGIGFVLDPSGKYPGYMSIIIAKHDW